jgi:hypothetical protein
MKLEQMSHFLHEFSILEVGHFHSPVFQSSGNYLVYMQQEKASVMQVQSKEGSHYLVGFHGFSLKN